MKLCVMLNHSTIVDYFQGKKVKVKRHELKVGPHCYGGERHNNQNDLMV